MPSPADPYRALGVPRGSTKAQIKLAHRRLAKRYHPDADGGDTRLFLAVQEAYRVLSDPLLRREWDARHAPGPVQANAPKAPAAKRPRATRAARAAPPQQPAQARPRSARSYTWSASEVPWWEEGIKRDPKRQARSRKAKQAAAPESETPAARPGGPDFEVYNRSSGAAWSMAARAYFRKGDQDLPRRGVFRHQGGQPVTAGRARAAAETEARATPGATPRAGAYQRPPAPEPTDPTGEGVLGRLRRKLGGDAR